jgi:BirA family biotin operon repressor/biotin-[acetyl-CoA-carboxylase] ligase
MSTKKKLLALLEENRGQNISGQYIAQQLNVSRTAVWKAVKELEKNGYKINAATNKGYCLSYENDILSEQGILAFSHRKDAKILVYPSVDSTNIIAKQMASEGAGHFTVIAADHQTAGKGRYGRSFFSPAGHGIYKSIIIRREKIWLSAPTLVTSITAVAVCEAIEKSCDKKPQIKWVNDIFLNEKKICGISTEAITNFESGEIEWLVVGIGVNFSLPVEGVPKELEQIVGTVFGEKDEARRGITRNQLAAEILNNMAALEIQGNQTEAKLISNYKSRMMMLGEKITVIHVNTAQSYNATAKDIDETGRLLVETESGEALWLSSGEISVRRAAQEK